MLEQSCFLINESNLRYVNLDSLTGPLPEVTAHIKYVLV